MADSESFGSVGGDGGEGRNLGGGEARRTIGLGGRRRYAMGVRDGMDMIASMIVGGWLQRDPDDARIFQIAHVIVSGPRPPPFSIGCGVMTIE